MNMDHSPDIFLQGLYDIDRDLYLEKGLHFYSSEDDTAVFFYCHCLPSFAQLIAYMTKQCGFDPGKIFILPKTYSAIPDSVELIKSLGAEVCEDNFEFVSGHYDSAAVTAIRNFIKCAGESLRRKKKSVRRVVLVDDGGFLTRYWCREEFDVEFDTISVQQTASGIYFANEETMIPKIDVARCAAKREFEANVIALGVVRKALQSIDFSTNKIGIAGAGAIGTALARALADVETQGIMCYDRVSERAEGLSKELGARTATNATSLIKKNDIIFGCTGFNFCHSVDPTKIEGEKRLYSCSSRDKEFLAFLQNSLAESSDRFGTVFLDNDQKFQILNGGFPINFDRRKEWEKSDEIVIIRNLILASIFQSMTIPLGSKNRADRKKWPWSKEYWKIEPFIQKYIVGKWYSQLDDDFRKKQKDPNHLPLSWWDKNSAGDTASTRLSISIPE